MKSILTTLLSLLTLVLSLAQATELPDEELFETIEAQRLVVNWNPRSDSLATVLVYTCDTCEIQTMFIDARTQLVLGEEQQPLDINALAERVDWNGHVRISNQAPTRIIKLQIFE